MRDHRSLKAWKEARKADHRRREPLGTRKHFTNHLRIAYGSAVETGDLLDLAREETLLPPDLAGGAIEICGQCQRLLLGLIKRYRNPP